MLKKIDRKFYLFALIFYLLLSIVFLYSIIFNQGVPFKYDWFWTVYDLNDFKESLLNSDSGLLSVFSKNMTAIFAFFNFLHLPPGLVLRIFLVIIHTVAGYSFYLFCSRFTKSKIISMVAGIFYAFTPYIFIRTIVGFLWSLSAYALIPILLNLYFDQNKKIWKFVLSGFLLTLIFAQPQAGVLIYLVFIINLILSLFTSDAKTRTAGFLMTSVFAFLFYLPWIIIYLYAGKNLAVVAGGETSTLNFIAALPHSLKNTVMLSDHLITKDFFYALAREKIFLAGFSLVILTSLASLLDKKNRLLIASFLVASIVVLPISIGPSGIFTNTYIWLFSHLPLVALFRETYHVEFLYAITLSITFFFGSKKIIENLGNIKIKSTATKRYIQTSVATLCLGSMLFIICPYFTFNYAEYMKIQQVPKEYQELYYYLKENRNYCQKTYYPPSLGFIYFKDDKSFGAVNADVLAQSMAVPYVTEGSSVLNLPSKEMYFRNELTSQFLETTDDGSFINLLGQGAVDCVIVRSELDTKYDQVSNLWRDPDTSVRQKWMNSDMLTLARNKQGLEEVKSFGDKIYIFKISNFQFPISNENMKSDIPDEITKVNEATYLPLTDWATQYDYYGDGWSRGRYAFWRKMLFAELRQDFLYTALQDAQLSAKIDQRGSYELWIRYMTGGAPGNFQLSISNPPDGEAGFQTTISKDAGEEKFVWKNLGQIDTENGKIEITNTAGENAIADIVLVKK